MELNFVFFFNSILLGVGLAMDAFSVSLANGLNEPTMKPRRMSLIAGVFAVFQALMPLIGWFLIHTICQYFAAFEKFIQKKPKSEKIYDDHFRQLLYIIYGRKMKTACAVFIQTLFYLKLLSFFSGFFLRR